MLVIIVLERVSYKKLLQLRVALKIVLDRNPVGSHSIGERGMNTCLFWKKLYTKHRRHTSTQRNWVCKVSQVLLKKRLVSLYERRKFLKLDAGAFCNYLRITKKNEILLVLFKKSSNSYSNNIPQSIYIWFFVNSLSCLYRLTFSQGDKKVLYCIHSK